jgi:hypothetical protein
MYFGNIHGHVYVHTLNSSKQHQRKKTFDSSFDCTPSILKHTPVARIPRSSVKGVFYFLIPYFVKSIEHDIFK